MPLPPGARLVLRVTAVTDDTVTMEDERGVWRMPRHGALADAKVGDVYEGEVRFKKPTTN